MEILKVTAADFAQTVQSSENPVLLDFWASWCGPCKMLAPVLEKAAVELDGKIVIGKVNIDEEGALAEQFSVMSIPTLILFRNGVEVKRLVGVQSLQEILSLAAL